MNRTRTAPGPFLSTLVFLVISSLIGTFLFLAFRGGVQGTQAYRAVFTDASGLKVGEDVRAAGIPVGKVTAIDVNDKNRALVSFATGDGLPLTYGTRATIRYKNLTGDRFLALSEGPGSARKLPVGSTIPVGRTAPALDLDELYNGFAPLFQGLNPDQINRLSGSIIQIVQGQGGSFRELLHDIGSLTGTVADRDKVIGQLIDNLNTVLDMLNRNDDKVTALVDNLQHLVKGLAADRKRIGTSLDGINDLTGSLSGLLADARPDIAGNVHEIHRLTSVINADPTLESDISKTPGYYSILGRIGSYSSAFQFYLCGAKLRLTSPTGEVVESPMFKSEVKRCEF